MNRKSVNFLSSLITADESAVWDKKSIIFSIPLPISENAARIAPPLAETFLKNFFPYHTTEELNCVFLKLVRIFLRKGQKNKPKHIDGVRQSADTL